MRDWQYCAYCGDAAQDADDSRLCFWPSGCANSERCSKAGMCIAKWQNANKDQLFSTADPTPTPPHGAAITVDDDGKIRTILDAPADQKHKPLCELVVFPKHTTTICTCDQIPDEGNTTSSQSPTRTGTVMMDKFDCDHIWIANSGNGGEPGFTQKAGLGGGLLMHVKCSECNSRTWLSENEWDALTESTVTDGRKRDD